MLREKSCNLNRRFHKFKIEFESKNFLSTCLLQNVFTSEAISAATFKESLTFFLRNALSHRSDIRLAIPSLCLQVF